jgi:ankyrin repeat protein
MIGMAALPKGFVAACALFALLLANAAVFAHYRRVEIGWKLTSAASHGDLAAVQYCVAAWPRVDLDRTPNGEFGYGEPPLIAAAWNGRDDVIQLLLDHGANIDRRDSCGNTALNAALNHRHDSTAQLLLSRGANPNIAGEGTPLSNAAGNTPMVELLKSHGATRYPHQP